MLPEFAVIREKRIEEEDRVVVWVDTTKATYQGHKWENLSETYKRKFENLLFLSRPKDRLKILYK